MKRLSSEQTKRRDEIAAKIADAIAAYNDVVAELNKAIADGTTAVEQAADRYNEALGEARDFAEDVAAEAEAWAGERSERWNEGDAGQAHAAWREEWSNFSPEDCEPDLPVELDGLDEDALEALASLPDEAEA